VSRRSLKEAIELVQQRSVAACGGADQINPSRVSKDGVRVSTLLSGTDVDARAVAAALWTLAGQTLEVIQESGKPQSAVYGTMMQAFLLGHSMGEERP
jgi:hypothetical protein